MSKLLEISHRRVIALARGPNDVVKKYTKFIINGFRFHIKSKELKKRTQNSGIVISAFTKCYASSRDTIPREEEINYFGVLIDIVELDIPLLSS